MPKSNNSHRSITVQQCPNTADDAVQLYISMLELDGIINHISGTSKQLQFIV